MLEANLQTWFIQELKKHNIMAIKVVSPNRRGLPDTVVLRPLPRKELWVELRVRKKVLRHHELQKKFHRDMICHGADVVTVIGVAETEALINDILFRGR